MHTNIFLINMYTGDKMIKDIILDFDGTIADSHKIIVPIFNRLADKYGLGKITEDELLFLKGLSIKERCKKFSIPLYKLPQMGLDVKKAYKDYIDYLQPVDGMVELIHHLRDMGYGLSILSSNSSDNIKRFLINYDIDIFDRIYSSASLFGKHFAILRFLHRYNLDKDAVLYIGDEHRDIASCKLVPVRIAAVSWGYDSPALLLKGDPDFIANNPLDILKFIGTQNDDSQSPAPLHKTETLFSSSYKTACGNMNKNTRNKKVQGVLWK
jgi:phosphoglycolate phosphatase